MSDAAFKTAAFSGYPTAELKLAIARGSSKAEAMQAEVDRRAARDAGDVSVMTPGERLRHFRAAPPAAVEPALLEIAKRLLQVETLEARNRDSADFYHCHVSNIRRALEEAFAAGKASR